MNKPTLILMSFFAMNVFATAANAANYGFNFAGVCVKLSNGQTTAYNVSDSYCSSDKDYGFNHLGVCKKVTASGEITVYDAPQTYCDDDYGFNSAGVCVKLDYKGKPTVYDVPEGMCDPRS